MYLPYVQAIVDTTHTVARSASDIHGFDVFDVTEALAWI
jgi:hypothetical protein